MSEIKEIVRSKPPRLLSGHCGTCIKRKCICKDEKKYPDTSDTTQSKWGGSGSSKMMYISKEEYNELKRNCPKTKDIDFSDSKLIGEDYGSKPFQESWFTLSPIILFILAVAMYAFVLLIVGYFKND